MDSFELNKIIGAILGTLLFVMGVGFLAEAIYAPTGHGEAGYALPEPEEGAVAEAPEEEAVPLGVLLAEADAEAGAGVARKCASCHNFNQGEPNKTGPALYGVVGASIAHRDDFDYSDALLAHKEAGETWTYEHLNAFLESPKGFAPGTKMTFAGLRSEQDRADLLAYLQTLSDSPVPFPEPPAEEATGDDAAANAEATEAEDGEAAPEVGEETPAAVEEAIETEGTDEGPGATPEMDNAADTETDTDGSVEGSNPEEEPAVDASPAEPEGAPGEPEATTSN